MFWPGNEPNGYRGHRREGRITQKRIIYTSLIETNFTCQNVYNKAAATVIGFIT